MRFYEEKEKKTERVHIRTTKRVKDMLVEITERQEISISELIEDLVMGYYYKLERDMEELEEMKKLYGEDFEY